MFTFQINLFETLCESFKGVTQEIWKLGSGSQVVKKSDFHGEISIRGVSNSNAYKTWSTIGKHLKLCQSVSLNEVFMMNYKKFLFSIVFIVFPIVTKQIFLKQNRYFS